MKILLTGHQGYVGAGLMSYLGERHHVVGWGRDDDICRLDRAIIRDMNITAVVNCAAVINKANAGALPDPESERVNIDGTRAIVSALEGTDIRLIQISTKDVFGQVYTPDDVREEQFSYRPRFLVDDAQPFAPQTIYGRTKLAGEVIAHHHPGTVVVRLSTAYTDNDHCRGGWVLNIMKKLAAGGPVTVASGGKQFRDPLHTDDLGRLIELILESGRCGVKINAGGGRDSILSIRQYINMLNPEAKIAETGGGDYGFAFNNRLAGELFGWKPRISLADRIPVIRESIAAGRHAGV